ncbi:MAG: DUF6438 domain-containing protein [Fluviicola sp.]
MRFLLVIIVPIFFLSSCKNEPVDHAAQIREELQGMWLLHFHDDERNGLNQFTLYFKDSICHIFNNQSNLNRYKIKDSILELRITTSSPTMGNRVKFKIRKMDQNHLELYPISPNLKAYCKENGVQVLKFHRAKQKNQFDYRVITFGSSGCFGTCPSFNVEIDRSGKILYEGFYFVEKEGKYRGERNDLFYNILKDKLKYIHFKTLKKEYKAPWTDDQTVVLIVETEDQVYSTSAYGAYQEPAELRVVFQYIFDNLNETEFIKSNSDFQLKYQTALSKVGIPEMEETIQFLPPVVTDQE